MCFTQNGDIRTSARVTVYTFKHFSSLPLVHRTKAVLLVLHYKKASGSCSSGVFRGRRINNILPDGGQSSPLGPK